MGSKETLKEEAFLGSTEDGANFDQDMLPVMETFEINGKVRLPSNAIAIAQKPRLLVGSKKR